MDFTKKRSTEAALLKQKELAIIAFESKFLAHDVFIDLMRAFDHINPKILISKPYNYGVCEVASNLMESYLQYRKQYVSHNFATFTTESIHSGVFQGSLLGPLLFILYINYVLKITNKATIIAYADDISVFFIEQIQITEHPIKLK